MSSRVESQSIAKTVVREMPGALRQSFGPDLGSFQAPFSERRFVLITVDAMLVLLASLMALSAWMVQTGQPLTGSSMLAYAYWLVILMPVWLGVAWLNDLYHIATAHNRRTTMGRIVVATLIGGLLITIPLLVLPIEPGAGFSALFWVLLFMLISGWRLAYSVLTSAVVPFHQRVVIVGTGTRSKAIAEVMEQSSDLSYQILGHIHYDDGRVMEGIWGTPVIGEVNDLARLIGDGNVHQVVVATEDQIDEDLFHALVRCQSNGVIVSWMPDLYEKLCHRIPIEHIDPAWGLYAVQDRPIFHRLHLTSKRLLDLALFTFALPIFAVIVPLLAIAIRLDSSGPVFYKQVRSGRGGQPFWIYKFRTMVTDAEKNGKPQWAQKNDSRITRVGRFLRKTRLDELPQILNVLRGEMSFVGPRPERPEFVAELEDQIPFFGTRLMVKPGLTGWAQIHYDYGNTVDDARMKLQYDFYYVRYWSLWMDIYVLFRTIAVVAQFKGM